MLKRRFQILLLAPEFSLPIQARIPAALCAMHNFISIHDPGEDTTLTFDDDDENAPGRFHDYDHEASADINAPSTRRDHRRDDIAQAMWDDYLANPQQRHIGNDSEDSDADNESMADSEVDVL